MTIDNISFRMSDIKKVFYNDENSSFTIYNYDHTEFIIIVQKKDYNKHKKFFQNYFKEDK